MSDAAQERLAQFQAENNVTTKGPLALVLQLTAILAKRRPPWRPNDFLTKNRGQVAGLGGGNLRKILASHGITRVLASEGGRTSRGNMGLMIKYVDFMDSWRLQCEIDMESVESYWADRVSDYFLNQPFTLPADPSRTIGANLDELFEQVRKRQAESPGTQCLGTVLQQLVAAKLTLIMPEGSFSIHGASVADSSTDRSGDFVLGQSVIHCTTAPGEPLIRKCVDNLKAGTRPVIITLFERVHTALDLAADAGLKGRVEVWDVQQFLATNVSERSLFDPSSRNAQIGDIIDAYNQIIESAETDPSLRIEFEAS